MLHRQERIRKGPEFKEVFEEGETYSSGRLFRAYVLRKSYGKAKAGFVVSSRLGSAVGRNRIKRLFREAFRGIREKIGLGCNIVFVPRAEAREASLSEIKSAMEKVLFRARILHFT